jgi:hypothetical protein
MSGTPMQKGQMCGNEDSNILVNQVSSNGSSDYLGCYQDASNRAMSVAYNGGSQQYSNSQCQQIAKQSGYQYYGLQDSTSGTNAGMKEKNDK